MNNTLVARGPSFKRGAVIETPTGNVDVAPTILHLLGLPGGEAMDGRVLREALVDGPDPADIRHDTQTHTSEQGSYRQHVIVSTVGDTSYVDEGNSMRVSSQS